MKESTALTPSKEPQVQTKRLFFNDGRQPASLNLPDRPTDSAIHMFLSENNANCQLNNVIVSEANRGNMRTLRRFAFTALKRWDHSARGCNFGIYAESGQGKTFVVKQWANTIELPFVFVQSASIKSTWELFDQICSECEKFGTPIVPMAGPKSDYTLPPMIVFFDEAHALATKMMKAGLLNAMESDDGFMLVKPPGTKDSSVIVNCKHVCWVAATTERGMLFDAFANRLETNIEWVSANTEEIARIVKMKMDKLHTSNELPFSIPMEACNLLAKYRKVPREAIAFARKVVQQRNMHPNDTWEDAITSIAGDLGINDDGFSEKQVMLLSAAGQRPIAKCNMPTIAGCRIEQIEKYELPQLISYSNGGPFMVPVSGRGCAITKAGLQLLEKWGVSHNGDKITVEYFESKKK